VLEASLDAGAEDWTADEARDEDAIDASELALVALPTAALLSEDAIEVAWLEAVLVDEPALGTTITLVPDA